MFLHWKEAVMKNIVLLLSTLFLFSCAQVNDLSEKLDIKGEKFTRNYLSSDMYVLYDSHRDSIGELLIEFANKLKSRNPKDFLIKDDFTDRESIYRSVETLNLKPTDYQNNLLSVFKEDDTEYRSYLLIVTMFSMYEERYSKVFLKYEINEKGLEFFHNFLLLVRHQLSISQYILTDETYFACKEEGVEEPCEQEKRFNYTFSSLITRVITYTKDDYLLASGGPVPMIAKEMTFFLLF